MVLRGGAAGPEVTAHGDYQSGLRSQLVDERLRHVIARPVLVDRDAIRTASSLGNLVPGLPSASNHEGKNSDTGRTT